MADKSVFEILNGINVNDHIKEKGNLTYLPWSWAWGELKKVFPDATYKVYENEQGWNYFTDGRTCWVKTGVTVQGVENIEYLPIMDFKNKSIPLEAVTSMDVNKSIQRSLTKAIGRHGLGLYIYMSEDIPEEEADRRQQEADRLLSKIDENQIMLLRADLTKNKIDENFLCALYNVTKVEDITNQKLENIKLHYKDIKKKQEASAKHE